MAKSESITFQSVAKLCNDMVIVGNKPSVRKLKAQLGGSHSTLSEFLNQWRTQQALAHSNENELSEEFNQALLAEFSRVTEVVREKSKLLLNEKDEQLTEERELLAEYESRVVALEKALKESEEKVQSVQLALEKKLAVAEGDSQSAKHREKELQNKLDALVEKCHQAELRAAIAETKTAEFNKREGRGVGRKNK